MTIPASWNESWTAALVNHLWQSTVVVGIAWLLALLLRKNHARTRYCVWIAASMKFLLPFSLLIDIASRLAKPAPVSFARSEVYFAMDQAGQPFSQTSLRTAASAESMGHLGVTPWLPEILAAVWLCGFIALLTLWLVRWMRISMVARRAAPLNEGREWDALRRMERAVGMRRPIRMHLSSSSAEPGVFGIVRPVLLWPIGVSAHLEDAQLDAVFAHELCHVRRCDNLVAIVHMLVEALFWFHPAVWWMGRQLIEERERACDEDVLQKCQRPQVYAESILKVCEFCLESPLVCVAGVTGSDLKKRIVRIMTVRLGNELSLPRKMLLAGVVAVMVTGPLGFGLLHAMQANAPLLHLAGTTRPEFEVATIKPSKDAGQSLLYKLSPIGFEARHASLKDLIVFAYVMKSNDQLVDPPKWSNSEFFDIQAKYSEADIQAAKQFPMDEQMNNVRLRVQSLLADRFQLKTRVETRDLPVYALVVAKGGIKMKEVEADPPRAPGTPPQPNAHSPQIRTTAPNQWTATAWPVNEMTVWLSHFEELGNRIVVNETGLTGHYDWVLNGVSQRLLAPELGGSAAPEPVTSIFIALPEQLGLKLVSQKAPVEVLVIDHVEQPTPN